MERSAKHGAQNLVAIFLIFAAAAGGYTVGHSRGHDAAIGVMLDATKPGQPLPPADEADDLRASLRRIEISLDTGGDSGDLLEALDLALVDNKALRDLVATLQGQIAKLEKIIAALRKAK